MNENNSWFASDPRRFCYYFNDRPGNFLDSFVEPEKEATVGGLAFVANYPYKCVSCLGISARKGRKCMGCYKVELRERKFSRKCILCGTLVKRKGLKYCSVSCSLKNNNSKFKNGHLSYRLKTGFTKIIKKCELCSIEFESIKWKKNKFCDDNCYRKNLSLANSGNRNKWWRGGITSERHKIYNSSEYKRWRSGVFKRDSYTCQHCGQKGGKLNADHIKPYCAFPELRFDLLNGRTLCLECHIKTPTFGGKANKYVQNKAVISG